MESLNKNIVEFGMLLKKTQLQQSYKRLLVYIKEIRNYFKETHPEYDVSTNLYQGYMDLTFFTITSQLTRQKDLKYIVVFTYENMQFEVWLAGKNRAVMSEYHKKFKDYQFKNFKLTEDIKGMSSILEHIVVENPNFDELNELTNLIDGGVSEFIKSIDTQLIASESV